MSFIDSDSVGGQAAEPFSIFAAAAIAGTATATNPAGKRRDVYSADKPTENTNKALKENWITGIASGDGGTCSEAA
jgi:hypothetical protein